MYKSRCASTGLTFLAISSSLSMARFVQVELERPEQLETIH